MNTTAITLYGPDGRALTPAPAVQEQRAVRKAFATYISALYGLAAPSLARSREPFANHAWVYAGAMAIAINISQAPFLIWRETRQQVDRRLREAKQAGRQFVAPAGSGRRAVHRHLMQKSRRQGMRFKGLEPDLDHPLMQVFARPNDTMSGAMLWQATALFQVLRGACMWVLFGENGQPIAPGDVPAEIWPMPPELFRPIYSQNRLAGWTFTVPKGCGVGYHGRKVTLAANEVIEHRFINPDPNCFWMGFATITPTAAAIDLDMRAAAHSRATFENGCDPGGVLMTDDEFPSDAERDSALTRFEERHRGEANRRRLAILEGGLKYISTGMTPVDMDYVEQRRWDRDEILAAMGVPKSILSITDDLNYAIQRSQDKNFWDKRLIPIIRGWEDEVDRGLLFTQQDTVVGAFDLSVVEALREGMSEAVATADKLASEKLHLPPREALELVGIDAPEYEGQDVALVSPLLAPVGMVIDGSLSLPAEPEPDPDQAEDLEDVTVEGLPGARRRKAKPSALWSSIYQRVLRPAELQFAAGWRRFCYGDKKLALDLFDKVVKERKLRRSFRLKEDDFPIDAVLLPLKQVKQRLKARVRPIYANELLDVFEYTVEEIGGIAVFSLDDPQILAALDDRERLLLGTAPESIQHRMRQSLRRGLDAGDTIAELRQRVAHTYDVQASSAKALTVARTESAGFMNDARDRMFDAQGLTTREWLTANDEAVRETHKAYGAAGPRQAGFNYLELASRSGEGRLEFPSDSRAPADEVINCRCVHIPAT